MSNSEQMVTDGYFERARSWADSREDELRRSRRAAWIIASLATTVAVMAILALFALAPLKTVVPYTLLVDRETGFVQTLKPADMPDIAPDSALTQSMLAQYVVARETFDITELQHDYRKVGLWSSGQAKQEYAAEMRAGNPAGPLARLPRTAVIQVRVRSISPLSRKAALIRFETFRRDQGQRSEDSQSWVAIVRYQYSTAPMTMDDRLLNPLGFQVTSYRRDAEAPLSAANDPDAPTNGDDQSTDAGAAARELPPTDTATAARGAGATERTGGSVDASPRLHSTPQGSPLTSGINPR